MAVVVDDFLLLEFTVGRPPARLSGQAVHTTGAWYFRLSQALRPGASRGRLSRRLAELPDPLRARALAAMDGLPANVGLLSLRRTIPVVRRLDPGGRLNLLAAEALASAYILRADVLVSTDTPLLREACSEAGLGYETLSGRP